jgi:hypothetical protein
LRQVIERLGQPHEVVRRRRGERARRATFLEIRVAPEEREGKRADGLRDQRGFLRPHEPKRHVGFAPRQIEDRRVGA